MGKEKLSYNGFTLVEIMIVIAIISILATVAIPAFLTSRIIPNFAIAKFAPKGLFGKSDEDLPILRGNPGFLDLTILYSCKIWDTLPWSIWKDCPGLVLRNSTNLSGQNRPNSRRVWSCSPSHVRLADRLRADFSKKKSGINSNEVRWNRP